MTTNATRTIPAIRPPFKEFCSSCAPLYGIARLFFQYHASFGRFSVQGGLFHLFQFLVVVGCGLRIYLRGDELL